MNEIQCSNENFSKILPSKMVWTQGQCKLQDLEPFELLTMSGALTGLEKFSYKTMCDPGVSARTS